MPTNWPPATAPPWPPPELGFQVFEASDFTTLQAMLGEIAGKISVLWRVATPTTAENTACFKDARCDHGHQVTGRILVSPLGVRYPFALCNNAAHRDFLVPWPPYYCGTGSQ